MQERRIFMRKKYVVIPLILSFVLLLTSCTAYNEQTYESHSPPPTPKTTEAPLKEVPRNTQTNDTYSAAETLYIGNLKTKKFHLPDCYTLPAEKNRIEFSSRDKAINSGYSPCGNCYP